MLRINDEPFAVEAAWIEATYIESEEGLVWKLCIKGQAKQLDEHRWRPSITSFLLTSCRGAIRHWSEVLDRKDWSHLSRQARRDHSPASLYVHYNTYLYDLRLAFQRADDGRYVVKLRAKGDMGWNQQFGRAVSVAVAAPVQFKWIYLDSECPEQEARRVAAEFVDMGRFRYLRTIDGASVLFDAQMESSFEASEKRAHRIQRENDELREEWIAEFRPKTAADLLAAILEEKKQAPLHGNSESSALWDRMRVRRQLMIGELRRRHRDLIPVLERHARGESEVGRICRSILGKAVPEKQLSADPRTRAEQWGATFEKCEIYSGRTVLAVSFSGTKVRDRDLAFLGNLTEVESLTIWGERRVTDEALQHVAWMTQLRNLSLLALDITNDGVQQLDALKNLESLNLSGCGKVTERAMMYLIDQLPRLKYVNVMHTAVKAELLRNTHPNLHVDSEMPDWLRRKLGR